MSLLQICCWEFGVANNCSLIALEKVLQIMGDKRRGTRSKRKGSWTKAQDIDKSLKEQKSITV